MAKSKEESTKQKALDLALASIEKQFGKGSIMKLDSAEPRQKMPCIPFGIPSLDLAAGGYLPGGLPKGRIIEIYGPESSGKTTLTLHVANQCQKLGGTVAFVDAEHALDTAYASRLGVNIPDLLLSQPDNGEQALEITLALVESGAVDLLIVDSVAALTPQKELDGDMGDSNVGLQARLMSQAMRKLTGAISRSNCTVIFINQLRMKIGVMFGNPETTTGGNALKFYSSVRMDIRRTGAIKVGEDVVGQTAKVKFVKNKIAPPFKVVELELYYDKAGFDPVADLLTQAVRYGIVDKAGAWFSYGNEKIGQGKVKAIAFLEENEAIRQEIFDKVAIAVDPHSRGELPLDEEPSEAA